MVAVRLKPLMRLSVAAKFNRRSVNKAKRASQTFFTTGLAAFKWLAIPLGSQIDSPYLTI